MKVRTNIQYNGTEVCTVDIEKRVREIWKEDGKLVKDLKTIDIYYKVEDNKCYYVINDTVTGDFIL